MDDQFHVIRRRGVDIKSKGAGIDAFCKAKEVDKNVTLTLLIVNGYLSSSTVSNRYFKRMLCRMPPTWKCMSKSHLTQHYLPLCSRLVKETICLELKGRTACLIVDEMSKNGVSFFNIMLSSLVDCEYTTKIGVFFWDSVSLFSQSSESHVIAISEVNEYTIDNISQCQPHNSMISSNNS